MKNTHHHNVESGKPSRESQASLEVVDLVHPRNLPEVAFQSYAEMIASNADKAREDFLSGEVRNPHLEQEQFERLGHLDRGIVNLYEARDRVARAESDPNVAEATSATFEFRAAEMEFIKVLARLRYVAEEYRSDPSAEVANEVHDLTETARSLNVELYGSTRPEVASAAYDEVWSQIDNKRLHPSAQQIYDDLKDRLPRPNGEHRLPVISGNRALEWAGEQFIEQNADIQDYVEAYWGQAVVEHGEDYVCEPEDIADVFRGVIAMRGSGGEIGVELVPDQAALSWSSAEMAVQVGEKRAAITDPAELFRKVVHEYGVHGQRSKNGLDSGLSVLGTGLYTDTPRPDYLTFEEGFATTLEMVINSSETPTWTANKLGHYINISLVESERYDFRDTFETSWRYRLLDRLDDDQPATEGDVAQAQRKAYASCVRIFRGTQPDLSDMEGLEGVAPLTFNKDLAYLEGRLLAISYIEDLYASRDEVGFQRLFQAKYDATNPVQAEIVRRALGEDQAS